MGLKAERNMSESSSQELTNACTSVSQSRDSINFVEKIIRGNQEDSSPGGI